MVKSGCSWITARHNLNITRCYCTIVRPEMMIFCGWWICKAKYYAKKLLELCYFSFHFSLIFFRHFRVNPPPPILLFLNSFDQVQHVPLISAILNTWCRLLCWQQMKPKSCKVDMRRKVEEKILIFPMTNACTYSPPVLSLRNEHSLLGPSALRETFSWDIFQSGKEMLRLAPLPNAFPLWLSTHGG